MSYSLELQRYYPGEIEITSKDETPEKIVIMLKSKTLSQKCPKCGCKSEQYHSTYTRKISDLPILGKAVLLFVTAYKYDCSNTECEQKVFCEELEGFTGRYRRMTSRCEDLVKAIALNTSCEAASIICRYMGVQISGDTIIRILLRSVNSNYQCGDVIGVDDWAYKKRGNYGTIVCDSLTHKPVALLDGRDGAELKKWLKQNKHVKIVTRDRASSYAKAIKEALPNAIQVADRFHLYHNLLEAIKDAIGRVLPEKVEVTSDSAVANDIDESEGVKKTNQEKQEITPYEESRKEFIINLQALYKEGYTKKQIATMLKTTYKRIRKYLNGDPEHLCISGRKNSTRGSKLDGFKDIIHTLVCKGKQYKEIFSVLKFRDILVVILYFVIIVVIS